MRITFIGKRDQGFVSSNCSRIMHAAPYTTQNSSTSYIRLSLYTFTDENKKHSLEVAPTALAQNNSIRNQK